MVSYNELLIDDVFYKKYKSKNDYNEKTYDPAETIKGFVSNTQKVIKSADEEKKLSLAQIFIGNSFVPSYDDKFNEHDVLLIEPVDGLLIRTPIGYKIYV